MSSVHFLDGGKTKHHFSRKQIAANTSQLYMCLIDRQNMVAIGCSGVSENHE
jgi:hypothetical protein